MTKTLIGGPADGAKANNVAQMEAIIDGLSGEGSDEVQLHEMKTAVEQA